MAGELTSIHGVPELLAKLENPEWATEPVKGFFNRWALRVQRNTVANMREQGGESSWKDTGFSSQSITNEVDAGKPFPRYARVGSNQDTVRWGEYGTGLLSEDPDSPKRRYFPPPEKLDKWAIKHGFHTGSKKAATDAAAASPGTYGYLVSLAIYIQGGTKPRRFLRNAFAEAEKHMPENLEILARDIEKAAEATNGAG